MSLDIAKPPESGFQPLAEQARWDARMRRNNNTPYTDEQSDLLIRALEAWQATADDGRPLAWSRVAENVGVAESTLSELRSGKFNDERRKPNRDKYLRLMDEFLAAIRKRADRADFREFISIGPTERMLGVMGAAIRYNSMSVIIGPSGSGKTMVGRHFAGERSGAVFITINEGFGDWRGVAALVYYGLALKGELTPRGRLAGAIRHLQRNRNVVILIDEAQKLKKSGLEALRDIHDGSDPEGRANVPMVLLADENFYRLIVRSRAGEPSSVQPQLVRRMRPVLDLRRDGSPQGDGGKLFSQADIAKIVNASKLRLVDQSGLRWLEAVSNVIGYGSLGFAIEVLRMACDISAQRPLPPDDLRRAMRMMVGPTALEEADRSAGGELLRAAAG